MDSDHRHDLKENDLEGFLRNFGQWWERWGTTCMVVLLVAAVLVLGYRWVQFRQQKEHEEAQNDLATATSPQVFEQVAKRYSDPAVRNQALLRGADLWLEQATDPGEASGKTTQEIQQLNASAQRLYEQVYRDPQADEVFKLNAALGLAAVAENGRNWPEARRIYQQIQEQAADKYPSIVAQASQRLRSLDLLAQAVPYAPEPVVEKQVESNTGQGVNEQPHVDENPAAPAAASDADQSPETQPLAP